ncbi:MAG: ABC transporter permease, partial [Candidatus Promineifilaceae bacterium]
MRGGWRRFFGRAQNWVALAIIGLVVAVAIAAPALAPPAEPGSTSELKRGGDVGGPLPQPPSAEHPLGTTQAFDVYHTFVWGTRSALRFGLTVALLSAGFGVLLGAVSGYAGGPAEAAILRVTDAFLAFPAIAAIWLLRRTVFEGAFIESAGLVELTPLTEALFALKIDAVTLALILFGWMPYARIVNASVAQAKRAEYVLAARASGASPGRILFRHVLPNAAAPAVVLAARDVGAA